MVEGACLPHCYMVSPLTVLLARFAFIYIIACAGYYVLTRNIGTPFGDSLTAEQKSLKATSVKLRRKAFCTSALVGLSMIIVWKPFVRA